jgi:hypothetical protein
MRAVCEAFEILDAWSPLGGVRALLQETTQLMNNTIERFNEAVKKEWVGRAGTSRRRVHAHRPG